VDPARVRAFFDDMDRGSYVRAYGNRSSEDLAAMWTALSEKTWGDQTDATGIPAGWRDDSGQMHVEALMRQEGIRWVKPWLDRLTTKPRTIAVGNVGPARDVADELETAGMPVLRVSQADLAAAVSRHRQELAAGTWWHRVNTDATASAAAVSLRNGRWDRPGDTIALVGSMSLSGWGVDHTDPEAALSPFWMS
jgi:hypothetical protein